MKTFLYFLLYMFYYVSGIFMITFFGITCHWHICIIVALAGAYGYIVSQDALKRFCSGRLGH